MELNDFEVIDRATEALTALSILLEETITHDPGALQHQGYGLGLLIRTHVETIRERADHLSGDLRRQRADEARVALTGMAASSPRTILQDADLGDVARDVNLKEDTVRRVVEQLLAGPPATGVAGHPDARRVALEADVPEDLVRRVYAWLDQPVRSGEGNNIDAGRAIVVALIARDLGATEPTIAWVLRCRDRLADCPQADARVAG